MKTTEKLLFNENLTSKVDSIVKQKFKFPPICIQEKQKQNSITPKLSRKPVDLNKKNIRIENQTPIKNTEISIVSSSPTKNLHRGRDIPISYTPVSDMHARKATVSVDPIKSKHYRDFSTPNPIEHNSISTPSKIPLPLSKVGFTPMKNRYENTLKADATFNTEDF